MGVMIFTLIAQALMVQYGGEFVGTTPLSVEEWLYCLGIGAIGLPIGLLLRSVFAAPVEQKVKKTSPVRSPSNNVARQRWGKV